MRKRALILLAIGLVSLTACGQDDGGTESGGTGGIVSILGNAAMDEFETAFNDYNGYWQDNFGQFDPSTADSWEQFVRQTRPIAQEAQVRIERLAEAYAPLPDLFEAEIARGGIPANEVDEFRELVSAYGTWIEYKRQEWREFLDCIELDPAEKAVVCVAASADTTAKSDEVARRIYALQASLFGVTATPSPIP